MENRTTGTGLTQIKPNPPLAVALMLTATAFIAGTTLMAKALGTKVLGDPLHPLQISHGRFVFAFLFFAIVIRATDTRISRPNLKLHVGRTTFGWGGVSLMFAAAAFIPLGDATAISFLNPVVAMVFAIPLLGERVGPIRWGAAIVALFGAMILLRPTPASFQPAALLALGAAFFLGVEVIFIKKLSGREPPLQVLFVNNCMGGCISTLAVIWVWQMPSWEQLAVLAGLGGCMGVAQACFINAIARADASFAVPFSYATLVFATLYDWLFFAQIPDAVSYVGAAVIVAGAAVLAWREGVAARRAKDV